MKSYRQLARSPPPRGSARPAPSSRGRRGSDISASSAPPCGRAPRPMRRNSRARSLPSGVFSSSFSLYSNRLCLLPNHAAARAQGQSGRVLAIAQGAACSVVQPARCGSGVQIASGRTESDSVPGAQRTSTRTGSASSSLPAPTAMCRSPTPSTARLRFIMIQVQRQSVKHRTGR